MGRFRSGFVLPLLLLLAALLNWSLISFGDLLGFLFVQYTAPKIGYRSRRRALVSWGVVIFSSVAILSHAIYHILSSFEGYQWSTEDARWAKLIGFERAQAWTPPVACFLIVQGLAAFIAILEIYGSGSDLVIRGDTCVGLISICVQHIGSHLRVMCCLLFPAVQLIVGISYPSWTLLPFFVCSCVGLVDWSLTSNFLGLFRFQLNYQICFNGLPNSLGFTDYLQNQSGQKFVLLSWIRCDLAEMNFIMSTSENNLTEKLLPSRHSFFIRESRSGVRHTNVMLRGAVFRISLFALSYWTFHFASICAFGLLAYVGYILYAFPSLFHLHRLNGLLLVFILLWAISTYVFNVAFSVLNKRLRKDMEVWEFFGLWRYPIPGFFLLAQFCLGILVAVGNLVSNSVFQSLSDGDSHALNESHSVEEREETKVLVVATLAWGLRKSSRAIVLALIFIIAMEPGFIHGVYVVFFMIYMLGHNISKSIRKSMIILCEVHFALLYILQLNLVSEALKQRGWLAIEILSQLGLVDHPDSVDLLKIAALACFCAIHNHGFDMLFSFSAILQHTPYLPIGFSILKAGLNKSVLLSVYTSKSRERQISNSSYERKIAAYLSAIGKKFLAVYRSCGTFIAFLTILFTVYQVSPNYASFGYLFFLLLWMTGRQLVERTKKHLWFPLKAYSVAIFIFIYGLSVFSSFETWVSGLVNLHRAFGYDPKSSMLENVWESLAVLIVMQLYSYERRQSKNFTSEDTDAPEPRKLPFAKRFLILHSEKILYLALLYASLSPISAFGFLYLLGLIVCATLPKSSRVPSKIFLLYSGLLAIVEYLFQMWGEWADMLPGQKHSSLAVLLGLHLFNPGFKGLEAGLRGKMLVIVACILQYNVFHWLDKMPRHLQNRGKWEEPCVLFNSVEGNLNGISAPPKENKPLSNASLLLAEQKVATSNSCPSFCSVVTHHNDPSFKAGASEGNNSKKDSFQHICGSPKENQKWNKRRVVVLRKERLEMQKTTLKIYMEFWIENMFKLFGLEINMIGLLLASFATLNSISLLYIASLAACILLRRAVIQKLWPIFVFLFGSLLTLEYLAIWLKFAHKEQQNPTEQQLLCHDCWRSSDVYFEYCTKCWLGIIVDDPRMVISYSLVFLLACFKLRADHLSRLSGSPTYQQMVSQLKLSSVLRDLSFETKGLWTIFDYVRLYSYCHLLDLVLALILITGTLEYDILHLGYLAFAMVFFRLRLEILKKKNKIFKYLRMYNFALIVFSLAYQSPFVGDFREGKCDEIDYIKEIVGFHKYDYGFRITSRSALVEIVIFMLVSLQSYMFSSQEFDYVSKYLEAEQIGALVQEQEKRAAWKTAQLLHIRKAEEQKRFRNWQVEKMKAEMLNLQIQLQSMSNTANCGNSPESEGLRRRKNSSVNSYNFADKEEIYFKKQNADISCESFTPLDLNDSPTSLKSTSPLANESRRHSVESLHGIPEIREKEPNNHLYRDRKDEPKVQAKENPIISAVQLIGDGVSQVQSLGTMAVTNLVSLLNIEHEEGDPGEHFSEGEVYDEIESQHVGGEDVSRTLSAQSSMERDSSGAMCPQILMIFRYIWAQMRSNNDIVCYCCFVLIFLWNFSLLSMVYPAALYLYALCVNTGPSYIFWVVMLMYTEVCVLLQYLYQISIQHCGLRIHISFLQELGFPEHKIKSSFVISNLPLFLVYLFTLLQSSITARDVEWALVKEFSFLKRSIHHDALGSVGWKDRIQQLVSPVMDTLLSVVRSLYRYWKSLTQGAETPPYFVQLSMEVDSWPEDGIQPENIESRINKLLKAVHDMRCKEQSSEDFHSPSKVRVQSIERSQENPKLGLAVFEVVNAAPLTESATNEWYESLSPAADVANEIIKALRAGIIKEIGFPYPILSVIGGGKREIDLYAYIFCADLLVFFLVAIFYQSVIKNNVEFLEVYQLEDQFPKEFVFVLMVIFFLIVLDRIIYLCSFATGKVIFYLFSLFLFTYSILNYAWNMKPSNQQAGGFALRAIFLTKAVSLALQAVQIRFGIPHKSTLYRQFLTSSITQVNFMGFRIYRALPFLYELRCVLDWSCTTTSLTMYDWLKLEDIHASLFLVKCDVNLNRAEHQQGQKQTAMTKFCNGICLFFILICVIWAPMLMYSSGNPTNIANPIKDAKVRIDLKTVSGRLTLFKSTLCEKISWDELDGRVRLDPQGYLSAYNEEDIQLICCQADASTLWAVPQVVQARFIRSLEWSMDIKFSWQFSRDRPKGKEVVNYEQTVRDEDAPKPSQVMDVLNGTTNCFRIHNVYPRYFRVTGSGDVRFLEQAVSLVSGDLVLNRGNPEWWSFHDINASEVKGCGGLSGPMAIIVSEETPQGILGETLSKFSIWGLYITFVLAVGRFIRLQCSDLRMRIPYENLPSCDRLLAICEDIYAARAEGELEVEEVLYWTLVKIYRSPHMLLEYTKQD
ncbi:Piezo non-specific cation channel, R-Ras-binding domain [Dillenia turbinata]|uniref:Piezo non-specific cation channel, R-Ras-binding domain n=1 Tax=Dillenia turbinata TaxID=194707 RepID=A0AAN8YUC4_9MAGN